MKPSDQSARTRLDTAPPRTGRIVELDALRGVATIFILLYHYTCRFPDLFGPQVIDLPRFTFGTLGVPLFFAISGFVILMTLDINGKARDFLRSRFLRLYPVFWIAMLLSWSVLSVLGLPHWSVTPGDVALNFTLMPELLRATPVDGVYWTLQIELLFYAGMLALSVAGQLPRIRWWLAAWLALRAAEELIAPRLGLHFPDRIKELLLLQWMPWFGIGILFYQRRQRRDGAAIDLALVAAIVLLIACTEPIDMTIGAVLITATFWALANGRAGFLQRPFLIFFGTISYPLYLTHQNIGYAIMLTLQRHGMAPLVAMLVTLLPVIGLASAICFFVERPLMRRYSRRSALRPAVRRPTDEQAAH